LEHPPAGGSKARPFRQYPLTSASRPVTQRENLAIRGLKTE
jgi:hypothetical protein